VHRIARSFAVIRMLSRCGVRSSRTRDVLACEMQEFAAAASSLSASESRSNQRS
jgi:hypothetical protein